jgi:hypothetical protein
LKAHLIGRGSPAVDRGGALERRTPYHGRASCPVRAMPIDPV